jgi:hypothetical protein
MKKIVIFISILVFSVIIASYGIIRPDFIVDTDGTTANNANKNADIDNTVSNNDSDPYPNKENTELPDFNSIEHDIQTYMHDFNEYRGNYVVKQGDYFVSAEGGTIEGYYDNGSLKYIEVNIYGEMGRKCYNIYYIDELMTYFIETVIQYDNPIYYEDGYNIIKETKEEYIVIDGKVCKYSNVLETLSDTDGAEYKMLIKDFEKVLENKDTVQESVFNYERYTGKTWIGKSNDNIVSFSINKVIGTELFGQLSTNVLAIPSCYDIRNLTGEVNGNIAECQFSDSTGNEGTIKLIFMENGEIEADIDFTKTSKYIEPQEGIYLFRPFNLEDMDSQDNTIIDQHIVSIELGSREDIRLIPLKLSGGSREPLIALYLADNTDDIIYRFLPDMPIGVDLSDIACEDVNSDKLKDVIIIYEVEDYKGDILKFVMVYLQNDDGRFINDSKLDHEISKSDSNGDIDSVIKSIKNQ